MIPAALLPAPEATFRHRLGLRPLDLSDWCRTGEDFADVVRAKAPLLSDRLDEVLAVPPGTEVAATEVLDALVTHLRADHRATHRPVPGGFELVPTGEVVTLDALHPLDACGRLSAEDWCLLDDAHPATEGGPRLVAASLCAPNRWRLADKLGTPMLGVHAPVPGYAAEIGDPVDATLRRLRPERPVWRANWGIVDDPTLFQPEVPPPHPGLDPAEMWLRVERQTLRRFPGTAVIAFTIRTYQQRLGELAAPALAGLAAAVSQLPPAVTAYKGLDPYLASLRSWTPLAGAF